MTELRNPEAEHALIVRMILEPETIGGVVTRLGAGDFSESSNARVYEAIRKRFTEGAAIDTVVIEGDTGIRVDILDLPLGSKAPVDAYVAVIADSAIRRELASVLESARYRIESSDEEPVSIVEAAIARVLSARGANTLYDPVRTAVEYREQLNRRRYEPSGLDYGVPALDGLLLPAKPGRLIMVASRPSVGKTALASSIADHWAKTGPILFVSLEMTREELMDRAIARDSGYSLEAIIKGTLEDDDLSSFVEARQRVPIYYLDEAQVTMAHVSGAAARVRMMNDGKLSGIVIDYLQLMADAGDNEVYRIGNISHASKRLARAMGCPVLALVQFSRSIENAETPRAPRLSDMRDSGVLEMDADAVVALIGRPGEELREVHVLKQRQGRTGMRTIWFDGEHQKWYQKEAPQLAW